MINRTIVTGVLAFLMAVIGLADDMAYGDVSALPKEYVETR